MSNTKKSFSSQSDEFLMNKHHRDSGNSSNCSTDLETTTNKASVDLSILNDDRLIENLLFLENSYRVESNYFLYVQTDIKPWMRKTLANWMLEVCRNQSREDDVFVLAMNILDRFLSIQNVSKRHLQLLGTVCMFIAAKLRSSIHFNAETLVLYTDNSITIDELLSWEQFVLHKLRWDICAVTPNDYVPHFLNKLNLIESKNVQLICHNLNAFISLCSTEIRFCLLTPSIIVSACIYAALKSLKSLTHTKSEETLKELVSLSNINIDCLRKTIEQVEELIYADLKIRMCLVQTKLEIEEILLNSIHKYSLEEKQSELNKSKNQQLSTYDGNHSF